ncbi:restriction endonuclease subunit S [Natrinema longum]|uniref:restriction endonuclease subunit S n=1 Tax=Natrinema longum TaxID=370324 RepID=UPI001CCCCCD1|nr:restriction endonuclease subunit S [Natrinema longum]MBZ6497147.1 restriction endonuclease subunit S [Natrinema longum]
MSEQEITLDQFAGDSSDSKSEESTVSYVDYPDGWKVVNFHTLVSDFRYGTDTKSNTENNGYPTLRIPNIVGGKITTEDLKYTPVDDKEFERLKLAEGDILLIRTNGNPDYVGQSAVFSGELEDSIFASYLIRIRVDRDEINPVFAKEFLNSHSGRKEMAGWISTSAGNHNLGISSIENFSTPLPSLDEQRKIAGILQTVDQALETTEDVVSQATRVKKGLIQEFYSEGYYDHTEWQEVDKQDAYVMTRANRVPAEWEVRQSDEIADIKTGHTPSTSVDEYWDGDISWVDIHDLTQLEKTVIETTDDTITEEGLENSGAKLLPEGTLVLCRTGAIGETAILGKEMATDQDQVTFECDESVVLPRYLMYLFKFATPQLERLSAGSTHDKIQLHFFSDLEIPLPSLDEQQKMVDAIESVDDVVIANKEQLDGLKRLKKGLRQDLLSGDVRTAGKEIDIPDEVKNYEPE